MHQAFEIVLDAIRDHSIEELRNGIDFPWNWKNRKYFNGFNIGDFNDIWLGQLGLKVGLTYYAQEVNCVSIWLKS